LKEEGSFCKMLSRPSGSRTAHLGRKIGRKMGFPKEANFKGEKVPKCCTVLTPTTRKRKNSSPNAAGGSVSRQKDYGRKGGQRQKGAP